MKAHRIKVAENNIDVIRKENLTYFKLVDVLRLVKSNNAKFSVYNIEGDSFITIGGAVNLLWGCENGSEIINELIEQEKQLY